MDASAVGVSCPFKPVEPDGTVLEVESDGAPTADVPVGTVVVVVLGSVVLGTALEANPTIH